MKLFIVAVRDAKADVFGQPQFVPNIGGAVRSFGDEVGRADPQNVLHQHPEDFELFQLGVYDDATASFDLLPRPSSLAVGSQYAK